MNNYIEYGNRVAFHPGYYIKEIVDESGLTQEDFAKRLDTTPKNLSVILSGQQSLSIDMATKLSRMLGTSIEYWLNLQNRYDTLLGEFNSEEELKKERVIFGNLDYKYFVENYNLPKLPRQIDKQIAAIRQFLNVTSLTVFQKKDMAVSFRSASASLPERNIIKANIMVQIAINYALKIEAPKFDKTKFLKVVDYALTLTKDHKHFYPLLRDALFDVGVVFVILPNLPGSKINGATKKIGNNILLMVNDRQLYSDIFWFTLLHEIGHIFNGDYGVSFDDEKEDSANEFAREKLIPKQLYKEFLLNRDFSVLTICSFANKINRDPGIIVGRLQKDGYLEYSDRRYQNLRKRYEVKMAF